MKPENTFIGSVHNKFQLGRKPHYEKMHNAYRGGTWDVWYSGVNADMWIEYKWVEKFPKIVVPDLSALQLDWGTRRAKEGRKVAVIVGSHDGGLILDTQHAWEYGVSEQATRTYTRQEIAAWIVAITGNRYDSPKSGTGRKNNVVVL